MKTAQQQKLVYILYFPLLGVIVASSLIVGKYPESIDYVGGGLGVVVVLLAALAIFMIRNGET